MDHGRDFEHAPVTSGLSPVSRHARGQSECVKGATSARCLFDHLVGAGWQGGREVEADGFGHLEVESLYADRAF